MLNELYTIIVDGIPIGFFAEERHRDEAFNRYIKWGIKGKIS